MTGTCRIYELKASTSQTLILGCLYLLAMFVWAFGAGLGWLHFGVVLLIALVGWRQLTRLRRSSPKRLQIDPGVPGIRLVAGGQTYFYAKYKVYPSRWFAILRLIDNANDRTLILNPDSFKNRSQYQRLRYELGLQNVA